MWVLLSILALLLYFFRDSLQNGLVLWTVAFGGSDQRRAVAQKSRLHAYVARSDLLDEVSLCELYQLCRSMVDTEDDAGIEALQDVVLQYKFVSLYRERVDGSLRGMMLLDEKRTSHAGQDIVVFRLGLALFKEHYRGGALPYILFLYRALRSFVLHRHRPVYVLVKLFSYKSYMIAMNAKCPGYPRYDAETPAFEKSLMDEFGRSLETGNDKYDPETCVVKRHHVRLERHAAPIGEDELQNPHIRHFVQLNPDWDKGHCLVTCCQITPWTLLDLALSSIKRTFFCTSKHGNGPALQEAFQRQMSMANRMKESHVFESSIGDPNSFIITSRREDDADALGLSTPHSSIF